jgi:hypothetical protein
MKPGIFLTTLFSALLGAFLITSNPVYATNYSGDSASHEHHGKGKGHKKGKGKGHKKHHHNHLIDALQELLDSLNLTDTQKAQIALIKEESIAALKLLGQETLAIYAELADLNPARPDYSVQVAMLAERLADVARNLMIGQGIALQKIALVLDEEQLAILAANKDEYIALITEYIADLLGRIGMADDEDEE